jgi:ubiquinone/menaquinone biosynthesis C-methylase UbiE
MPQLHKHFTLANIKGMRRVHAFEFNDLPWFPASFRNAGTDFLQFVANRFDIYKDVLFVIEKGIRSCDNDTMVDIASEGGGGLVKIVEHLKHRIPKLKIILTDYYPNLEAFKKTKAKQPDAFEYTEASINAMDIPPHLKGFRTQFLSFHHFKPKNAKAILQNAVDCNQAIGIFEAQQRDFKNLAQRLLSPLSVLILTPFIKPFKFNQILFTYLIPIIPIFTLWDGVVSVLRTYTEAELKQMIVELKDSARFDWEVATVKGKQMDILYLLGTPVK